MAIARKRLDWDPKLNFEDLTPEQDAELQEAIAPEVHERANHKGPWLTTEEAFSETPSTSTP